MYKEIFIGMILFSIVGLFVIVGAQSYRIEQIEQYDNRLKTIEKVLKGGKYICTIRKKIKGDYVNCETFKNEQEQDND